MYPLRCHDYKNRITINCEAQLKECGGYTRDGTKWCSLCQRHVVPTKEFNSIGWVGLVAGVSYLVAALFNEPLVRFLTNNTLAAALATGFGDILLNVLLLQVAPLALISILYCLY